MTNDSKNNGPIIRIDAPEGIDELTLAQVVVGNRWLLKAERTEDENPFKLHKPLQQLYEGALKVYRAQLERMFKALDRYVEQNTSLVKAGQRLFTLAQLRELAQIIQDHHTGLAIGFFGPESVSPEEVKRLIRLGVIPKSAAKIIDDAYAYGQLLAVINAQVKSRDANLPAMSLENVRQRLKRNPIPLTAAEVAARDWAKVGAATYVRGLGNRVSQQFETLAIEADKDLQRRMQTAIKEELSTNIARRETWRKLRSELGHRTKDWSRDFGRIAATEKQAAMQEGQTQRLIAREGDPRNVLVAKVPSGNACAHCVRLHLTSGAGSNPKVFRLSDLRENGTNVGRKANDWRPIVGPTHPWCFPAGVSIRTFAGPKLIQDMNVDDLVFTHKGRWKKVLRLSMRIHDGEMFTVTVAGSEASRTYRVTPEHPLLTARGWVQVKDLTTDDVIAFDPVRFEDADVEYLGFQVLSIEKKVTSERVYNFAVEGDESYCLEDGLVSHNCECALVHIPEGWGFNKDGDLVPQRTRKSWTLERDLAKALSYGDSVPLRGVTVRVGDPEKLAAINEVLERTPKALFNKLTGVTLITTDHPSQNSHLEDHDYAYWTGNEIRLMQTLPLDKVRGVLEHELGHAPNVYLVHRLGSVAAVQKWHRKLYKIAEKEGFVSEYAQKLPIECAAEVVKMYLFDRPKLVLEYPKQFTFVHKYLQPILRASGNTPTRRRSTEVKAQLQPVPASLVENPSSTF